MVHFVFVFVTEKTLEQRRTKLTWSRVLPQNIYAYLQISPRANAQIFQVLRDLEIQNEEYGKHSLPHKIEQVKQEDHFVQLQKKRVT